MYKISDDDREIWKAAKEAQDERTGKKRRGVSWKSGDDNTAYVNPKTKDRYIKIGRVLYYKNRKTGKICQGTVIGVAGKSFVFRFDNRTRSLPLGIVNDRLFYTPSEAVKYGKMDK